MLISRKKKNEKNTSKYCFFRFLVIQGGVLLLLAGLMILVDPYFHYHKPLPSLSYPMTEERYINDGISRHFAFEGLITGTSMNQNFKTSEASALFGKEFVKEPFSGAAFQEISDNIRRSIERNENLDTVIWGLDYNGLRREADYVSYEDCPTYLYDNNPFNDVKYLYNIDILYHGLLNTIVRTLRGDAPTTFDEYASFSGDSGFRHIMQSYERDELLEAVESGRWVYDSKEEARKTYENVTKNLVNLVKDYPDVDFYLFYSPYCMLYWESLSIEQALEIQLDAEKMTTELLLPYKNVHLFSFFENHELIEDLSLYQNKEHYHAEVNSAILNWMYNGMYEITKENQDEHMAAMREYYLNFDYEDYFNRLSEATNGDEE